MLNNLLVRTLSGAFFVALIVASIVLGKFYFVVSFSVITAWSIFEFHKITNHKPEIDIPHWIPVLGALLMFVSSFLYASGILKYPIYSVYALFLMVVMIAELYRNKLNPIHNWAYFLMGQMYIALPFSLLNFILFVESYNPIILLAVFVTIWVNDSGAYLVGITLGKHRLFERVSPKKSWEGFFGGALLALGSGYVFSLFIPELSLLQWLVFSEIIVLFGTYGDLLESLLKRTIHVKDSGTAIPGHGGLLDRFDSMLLAAPAIYIFLSFVF